MSTYATGGGCTNSDGNTAHLYSQRLSHVAGDRDKTNDMFVYGELDGQQHVIYFGGDVQNYPENMEGNNARYVEWNTENTAQLLHHKFPKSLVFVVKPKEMRLKTLSVYSNFVESNDFGVPTHDAAYGAAKHLSLLYKSACGIVADSVHEEKPSVAQDVNQSCTKENDESTNNKLASDNIPISIIGFSKGCVVLNQLVYEIPYAIQYDPEVKQFFSKVKTLFWLDGGHNGGDVTMSNQHAYITEPYLVTSLVKQGFHISVHVTPYQVRDPLRPWLGKQYKRFCKLLRSSQASLTIQEHFEQEPGSLENHFKILEMFQT
ncbi:UPF0565 protein C2orf69 homolog [Elysia marginata]|uniref:UPF0565 protein C2orf69 homolog n=1 Tax=Elysia marginata TaxID=1093978 RepID=A0AAV4FK82_9GAST|nr:UPF0565 protein C2orf69 homolog [Elysia marginata]